MRINKEILKLANKNEWTVLDLEIIKEKIKERIAKRKWIKDKELLKLVINDHEGWTVAHEQASHGWTTEDKEILKLADWTGATVAHIQAEKGWSTEDKEILKLANNEGWTVAHMQAWNSWRTEDKEILKLADIGGWTVAHIQAINGWTTEDKEILKWATKKGWTVAHQQASKSWITNDKEILKLTDNRGTTVYFLIIDYWNKKDLGEINENFDKLFSFILELEKLGLESIKETQLYENVMYLAELKKLKAEILSKILKRINSRQKKNNINKN